MSELTTYSSDTNDTKIDRFSRYKMDRSLYPYFAAVMFGLFFLAPMGAVYLHENVFWKIFNKPHSEEAIREAFPNTRFNSLNFDENLNMFEGVTGNNVVYFSKDGQLAFIGDILDLEKRINITDARKANLQQFGAILNGSDQQGDADRTGDAGSQPDREVISSVSLEGLTEESYFVKNAGAGPILYVIADYNCGYCARLHNTLSGISDVEIREIPIGLISRDNSSTLKGASVLCSDDPVSKSDELYRGQGGSVITTCSDGEAIVRANTAWANQNGVSSTPTMFLSDGSVLRGAVGLDLIRDFVRGA